MRKPYYDPKTKETYLKLAWEEGGVKFVCKMLTGYAEFSHRRQKYVSYNDFGEEILRQHC